MLIFGTSTVVFCHVYFLRFVEHYVAWGAGIMLLGEQTRLFSHAFGQPSNAQLGAGFCIFHPDLLSPRPIIL
jgi:hypothetical protein